MAFRSFSLRISQKYIFEDVIVCKRPPMGGEQAVTCEAKLGLLQLLAPLDGLPLSMGDNNAESRCVS